MFSLFRFCIIMARPRFGVDGLVEAGHTYADDCIRRACDFLVSKQKEDGGYLQPS